ncbi:hypothetical protein [Lelliottia wanjuensis]|uniref:hypothetical protein n=1 Tax=Lelliottia wanjuensis TaxID=3050585 RepID=UPI00254CFE74|nr:hypothetical protein [Lelliottia sp. V104_15]MDK9605972.1 hypothetical protein [Lelliottia sp. V104_15]
MKKINYLNKEEVYERLVKYFPAEPLPVLSENMMGLSDSELVYDFFSGKGWEEIAIRLNLENDSYALELGVVFLSEDEFFYYIPLYIYASLQNKSEYWVFESDFIQHYLCPEYQSDDDFLSFILRFNDVQLSILNQFMHYESEFMQVFYARKACQDFWEDQL